MAIRRVKNVKFAEQLLILRQKKRQAEDQQVAQANAEQNAQIQQQSAEQKAKLELQKIEAQTKGQITIIKVKAEEERKLEELRFKGRDAIEIIKGDKKVEQQLVKGAEA